MYGEQRDAEKNELKKELMFVLKHLGEKEIDLHFHDCDFFFSMNNTDRKWDIRTLVFEDDSFKFIGQKQVDGAHRISTYEKQHFSFDQIYEQNETDAFHVCRMLRKALEKKYDVSKYLQELEYNFKQCKGVGEEVFVNSASVAAAYYSGYHGVSIDPVMNFIDKRSGVDLVSRQPLKNKVLGSMMDGIIAFAEGRAPEFGLSQSLSETQKKQKTYGRTL